MNRVALRPALFALLLALPAPLAAARATDAPAPPRLALEPCHLPGLEREIRCGRFEVFEDRAAARGRKIALRVVVLPSTGAERAADAVFYFEGGPGASAVADAAGLATEWAEINRRRDVVLVDVRGTGESNGLQCKALQGHAGALAALESFLPVAGVRACRQDLEPRANLALYTTEHAVDDVDDVRAALGYDRINVAGGSYGSLFALTYLRRHGEHVRTAMLEGVVPPGARLPLHFARDAQRALDQLLAACARDAACHAAFPDTAGELDRLLARLAAEPATVQVQDPRSGQPVSLALTRNAVVQTIRYMLYMPLTAAQIPLQVHLAAQGDLAPLAATAYLFGAWMTDMSDGYFLSVTCTEDVPFFTLEEAEVEGRGTFLGPMRVQAQKAACAEWPHGRVPAGFAEPVRSEVPTLLLSGERDPVTPAADAVAAARTLPRSLHLIVPGGGHSLEGLKGVECIDRIYHEFLERGRLEGLDTSCVAAIEPLPFVLRDERAAAVALSTAELDRFVGTYVGPEGHELPVRRAGDVLQLFAREGEPFALEPVGPARFRIVGLPAGFFVEFQLAGEKVTGAVLEQGPNAREILTRKP